MNTGYVKFYNSNKGFGFMSLTKPAAALSSSSLLFLERAGITSPDDGQEVRHELENGRDGRDSAASLQLV